MENHRLLHLILQADPVVQLVLLTLVVFSVVSWAIIATKHRQLKTSEKKNDDFLDLFWEAKTINDIPQKKIFTGSPAYYIFEMAISAATHKGNIERNVRRAYDKALEELEAMVPFLATTASAAPFIGLFGTVWGILVAFWKIGQAGASSLSIVGPHIAEALIATAVGLAAAIPAAIFYNVFINRIRHLNRELEEFTEDLVERLKR